MLTMEEQKQLDALLNKEREPEPVAAPLQAGNTTQTLAPKQAVEGTPSVPVTKIPRTAGVTIRGQHYADNGILRQWTPKLK
jgi:hypothetical protein